MRVINHLESTIVVDGISIPGGQHRNVRDFDPESERNQARIEAGDISVAGLSSPAKAEEEPEPAEDLGDPVSGWFSR